MPKTTLSRDGAPSTAPVRYRGSLPEVGRALAAIIALLAIGACSAGAVTGTGSGSTSDGVTVQVKPNHVAGWSGDTVRLHATVLDSDGKSVSDASVDWSSGDTTVATVDQSGLVTFQQLSTDTASVTISASVSTGGGKGNGHAYGSSDASNQGGKPTKVTVSPSSASIPVGSHVDLSATVLDTNGNKKSTGVSWSSSDTSLAVVSDTGVVTGRRTGTVTITADAGPASGSASIDVTPGTGSVTGSVADVTVSPSSYTFTGVGQSLQLTVTATDSAGNSISGASFDFSSTDPSVVSVDSVGLLTAKALGTALVVVSSVCCNAADTTGITVTTGSIDTVSSSADYPHLPSGMTLIGRNDGTVKEANGHAFGISDFGGWSYGSDGSISVISDASNPAGTGQVIRFDYGNGGNAGEATAQSFSGGPYQQLYFMARIYLEPGFWDEQGGKFWYVGASSGSRNNASSPTQFYNTGANGRLRLTNQNNGSVNVLDSGLAPPLGNSTYPFTTGTWLNYELLIVAESSPGAGDGEAYQWVNGTLVGYNTQIQWTTSGDSSPLFNGMQWYATISATLTNARAYRLGEFYIAGK